MSEVTVTLLAWAMDSNHAAVWFLYCPGPKLQMAIRIRVRPKFIVEGHHISGSCRDSVVMWTSWMEEEGLAIGTGVYVAQIDQDVVRVVQTDLMRSAVQDHRNGSVDDLLERVLNTGEEREW